MPDPSPRLQTLRNRIDRDRVFGAKEALELIDILLNVPEGRANARRKPPPKSPSTPEGDDESNPPTNDPSAAS